MKLISSLQVVSLYLFQRMQNTILGCEQTRLLQQLLRARTVLLDGFSKAYAMTGWRVGYVAAPSNILEGMLKVHQYAIMCAGTAPQEAAIEARRHGEEDVRVMHDAYDKRRRMFV